MSSEGMLPTRNFQDSSFEGAEGISGQEMKKVLGDSAGTCYACAVACKRRIKADPEHGITGRTGGPEYETIASLGSALGIDDIHAVVKANELCNDYGLDTISTGMTIAWATECFERGLLTPEDSGGMELGWNRPGILIDLINKIACREGFGKLLALGSKKAAELIGRGTEEYAMQVKGQELPGHEPRPKWSVALGYAVSPTGADHLQAAHDPWFTKEGDPDREWGYVDLHDLGPLGLLDPVPAESLSPAKVRMFTYLQHVWGFHDVLDICIFVTAPEFRAIGLDKIPQLLSAATGWNTSLFEVMKVGERWVNLLRCYNLREGFSGRDDTLPKRMFEPIRKGTKAGTKIDPTEFQKALYMYYGMMGWDENGRPRHEKLEELAIGWADPAESN
jgi:aldehyde:ferredoxin oxidoreductase